MFGPVDDREPAVLPRRQQKVLRRLVETNVAPFLTYIAHEVDRSKTTELLPMLAELGKAVVTRETASELSDPCRTIPKPPTWPAGSISTR